ncbi:MAG: hypothetical protein HQ483_16335 [Rhodospirillales bacterium]|nr:hypothetical protein [Rhodospirillales bacterium]
MSNPADDRWPQTAQGIADWEQVFEDSTNGFIPMVLLAHTPAVLKQCATIIIQQLFSRDDDGTNVMKFLIALNDIIPDEMETSTDKEALATMRTEISVMMRKIKADRKTKSEGFLKRKAQTSQERRLKP